MLVSEGRVAWVGTDAAAPGLGEPDTVVELDGAWLAPAFVDAHVHVIGAGLAMTVLDLSAADSLKVVLRMVRESTSGAAPDALIWGTGWDESRWPAQGPRRAPTSRELDEAAGGRFVYLSRADIHSAAASTALLHAAGMQSTVRAVTGADHHALRAAARQLLPRHQIQEAARTFFARAASTGIGMVHDCSGPDIGDGLEVALVRQTASEAGVDLVGYWGERGSAGLDRARGYGAEPAGDVFVDGSLGSRTAALSRPYAETSIVETDGATDPDPHRASGHGSLLLTPREIAAHIVSATAAGAQAGFHAIGDAAISAVVEGFERAAAAVGTALIAAARHRVEHVEMATDHHRSVLARLGVIASVQPAFATRWGGPSGMYAARLGIERAAAMNDFAAFAAAGVPLAFGSDAPVTPLDPWGALRAATSASSHSLSPRAAFAAHTRGGHRAARRDGGGVLATGMDATFAIWLDPGPLTHRVPDGRVAAWSTDPRAGTPGIPDLQGPAPDCAATVVQGRVIFDDGMLAAAGLQAHPRA